MANHKSAIKRARQNERRRMRNRMCKSRMKTQIKKVDRAILEKSSEQAIEELQKAISLIDKTASKGTIHKNRAARTISRLTRRVNNFLAAEEG